MSEAKDKSEPAGSMWEIVYDKPPKAIPELEGIDEDAAPIVAAPPLSGSPTPLLRKFAIPVTQEGLSLRVGR